ncbi:MAG: adenylate/guanylate cyclase domain-containing protein [Gammaproteobacteria bacterium]|nr:adenylate/guanylate cyclase domain-containing protein [Gammaproteobacteria bacterium]NNM00466.1 adenylate/guanylate cyclase domain-containing protein [Gammaproteobacteria bacterium]
MAGFLEELKKNAVEVAIGIVILLVFLIHASELYRFRFVDQLELLAYDARLVAGMPDSRDDRIVIVDIDERSLGVEGRWPWSRDKLSRFLEQLFGRYEAGMVAFDVVFAEPDESSGLTVLERLAESDLASNEPYKAQLSLLRPQLDFDGLFAEEIQKHPVVMGYYFSFDDPQSERSGTLPEPIFEKGVFKGKNVAFRKADGFGANLAQLQSSALSAGHFNPSLDQDGVVRRVPMLVEFDGRYYSSLALEVARLAVGVDELTPGFEKPLFGGKGYPGLEWLELGNRRIPVDRHVQTLVPYRGKKGSFPYVSATDVLNGQLGDGLLKGSIVLVGTTAPGLLDLRTTPVQEAYPGVEVHANLISGILDGRLLEFPAYAVGAEVTLLTLFGLTAAIVVPMLTPFAAMLLTAGLVAGYIIINLAAWYVGNVVFPLASGLLMLLALFLVSMSYGYFIETRGKRQLTGLFGQYVPPELVEEMAEHPDQYSLDADSRELTVLFSDVRGFTTLSEGLSPAELSGLMNEFLTPMTQVIHDQRGTIDKYMGDAIMAFWGAPLKDRDHAQHALEAGLLMIERLKELNKAFRAKNWPEIKVGVGVNTGMMSVGNMGSEFRMAYTVLGDAVNLGSRLEGLTKQYGVNMIVSESTAAAVPDYVYRELDRVRVKGKDEPIAIYEPIGLRGEVDKSWRDEIKLYREALKQYRHQEWDIAELQFLNLRKSSRSPELYQVYAERIAHFREHPPGADWDGVFTHTSK